MQIQLTTHGGHGETTRLPPEIALDDQQLQLQLPTVQIPGRDGAHLQSYYKRLQPRRIRASGTLRGIGPSDADALAESLRAKLLGKGELWLKRDVNADRFIRCTTEEVAHDYHRGRFGGTLATLDMTFRAFAPWWYAVEPETSQYIVTLSGQSWTVHQPGTSEWQAPVIRIECPSGAVGPLANPEIENTTTGYKLHYEGEIQPGEALAIRSHPMRAYKGAITLDTLLALWGVETAVDDAGPPIMDTSNVLDAMNDAWLVEGWILQPGDNQVVYRDDATSSHDAIVQIAWRPRYY